VFTRAMKELPWRYKAFAAAFHLSFFAFLGGFPVALLNHRVGASVLIFGCVTYLATHRVLAITLSGEGPANPYPSLAISAHPALKKEYTAVFVVFALGLALAAFGELLDGYLLVSGLLLQVALDALAGVRSYEQVMSRPWPAVAPLEDEDDW
jgi:hypothetical protein